MEWSLGNTVRKHAEAQADAPMIVYGDRTITWGEMDRRSNQVAQALAAEGVGPGDRVAFLDKNGPEYFEVLFGGGKTNAVNVAVNWRLAAPEVEYTVNDAEARVLFVGPEFVPLVEQIEDGLQTVKKIVALGGGHSRYETYDDWVGRAPADDPGVASSPDDVALQLYTSGTTGLPKGAMLVNRNFASLMDTITEQWSFDADSVSLVCMPLFHIGGSGWSLVGMWGGCKTILHREFVPGEILASLTGHRVTNAFFVPAMLQFLSMVPGAADGDYAALRMIAYGASPITDDALVSAMATFKCDFVQVYGLTETTGAITQLASADHDPGGPRAHLLRSAGRPFPWVELRAVDAATGETLPPGAVGEIWTRSVQNMQGYWNKPDATAQAFTDDGWFKTGDAGYVDAEGYVFLTDRVKDMIVSGGENVYPAEVENALSSHPAVADIAVIGVPDEKWGETVKAVIVKAEGADPTPDELIAYAKERLAGFKCPTSVDFIDALPRNPSGKILKRELRDPYWEGRDRRIN